MATRGVHATSKAGSGRSKPLITEASAMLPAAAAISQRQRRESRSLQNESRNRNTAVGPRIAPAPRKNRPKLDAHLASISNGCDSTKRSG